MADAARGRRLLIYSMQHLGSLIMRRDRAAILQVESSKPTRDIIKFRVNLRKQKTFVDVMRACMSYTGAFLVPYKLF